jgi:hypothetical protein
MVIIASKFDPSSQRIVRCLSETYDIAINTAFFTVFEDDGKTLLATDWLLDQAEVVERSEAKAKGPWSGLWYVNVGDGQYRSWDDMQRYGFIAAGAGEKFSGPLNRLQPEDRIVAYQPGEGYVGYGIVTAASVNVSDFKTKSGPLLEQKLTQPGIVHPRACGERARMSRQSPMRIGSSPRVRRTRRRYGLLRTQSRFIPARAENAGRPIRRFTCLAVHPRACGER